MIDFVYSAYANCLLIYTNFWNKLCLFLADLIDCGNPPIISAGSLIYTNTTFGSRANVQCNEGYIVNGNNLYTCEASRNWEGSGTCGKFCPYDH